MLIRLPASVITQCSLLVLPLEVRIEIYKHVLATGDIHEESGSPLLRISLRRHLRLTSSKSRINHYRLDNFSLKYFALSRTCKQIRREIKRLHAKACFTVLRLWCLQRVPGQSLGCR